MSLPVWSQILATERRHGRERVLLADWLDWQDWRTDTIITRECDRVRLVLLNARQPGTGAFTRLIGRIEASGLTPVLVEPDDRLVAWCERHGWRERIIGQHRDRHRVFYKRREP